MPYIFGSGLNIPELVLYSNVQGIDADHPKTFVRSLRAVANGWRRSIRSMGGYWQGSFSMDLDYHDAIFAFANWIGYNITEYTAGQRTWEGQIVEMDMVFRGVARRISLDLLRNYITVEYLDQDGEKQVTAAGENTQSTDQFLRYEGIVTVDGMDSTAAAALRDTQLKQWSWPYVHFLGADVEPLEHSTLTRAQINVTVAGYIHTANRKFQATGDGTADNVSDWIEEILTNDCEFLHPGIIAANTLQVYKNTSQPRRCWDLMQELCQLGDSSNNLYRVYCGLDGVVSYQPISTTIGYYLKLGVLYSPHGNREINPWFVQPAVVQDWSISPYGHAGWRSGGWLKQANLFYASEIDVGVDTGLQIKSEQFPDESEMALARLAWNNQNRPEE